MTQGVQQTSLHANAENFLEFTKEWAFGQDLEILPFWLFALLSLHSQVVRKKRKRLGLDENAPDDLYFGRWAGGGRREIFSCKAR